MAAMNGSRHREGLRIRGHRGDPEVRAALIRYARWLRGEYDFPVRVPVYLLPGTSLRTINGQLVAASFFAPWSRAEEPYIRIATGDYRELKAAEGRDNALAAVILSMSHECVHYQQWVETGNIWERGVARKALGMLRRYSSTVGHP
jgi:hypothetical protein